MEHRRFERSSLPDRERLEITPGRGMGTRWQVAVASEFGKERSLRSDTAARHAIVDR